VRERVADLFPSRLGVGPPRTMSPVTRGQAPVMTISTQRFSRYRSSTASCRSPTRMLSLAWTPTSSRLAGRPVHRGPSRRTSAVRRRDPAQARWSCAPRWLAGCPESPRSAPWWPQRPTPGRARGAMLSPAVVSAASRTITNDDAQRVFHSTRAESSPPTSLQALRVAPHELPATADLLGMSEATSVGGSWLVPRTNSRAIVDCTRSSARSASPQSRYAARLSSGRRPVT
jgi:hypothetical protein